METGVRHVILVVKNIESERVGGGGSGKPIFGVDLDPRRRDIDANQESRVCQCVLGGFDSVGLCGRGGDVGGQAVGDVEGLEQKLVTICGGVVVGVVGRVGVGRTGHEALAVVFIGQT